jgi:uncharacterized membrane protein YbhN (UPF0104 family)
MTTGLLAVPGAADSFAAGALRRRRLPAAQWLVAEAILIIVALAAAAGTDHDFAASVARVTTSAADRVREAPWQIAPALLLVAVVHYLTAAVALRTAAGVKLPLYQTFKVQLAAAAANRLTPAGLGGAAVNARYLTRKGQDGTRSISAVSSLGVLGSLAKSIVFVLVTVLGSWVGMHGGASELGGLSHRMTRPVVGMWHLLGWLGLIGIVVGAGLALTAFNTWRRRRPGAEQRAARVSAFLLRLRHDLRTQVSELVRAPRRLLVLLACSATSTLSLAIGFLLTAEFAPHGTTIGAGGLVIAYMLGGMAGSVAPGAGAGATEAALAGILIAGHMPASAAISCVLLFRITTFWAPAVAGVWAIRSLRREAAI